MKLFQRLLAIHSEKDVYTLHVVYPKWAKKRKQTSITLKETSLLSDRDVGVLEAVQDCTPVSLDSIVVSPDSVQ